MILQILTDMESEVIAKICSTHSKTGFIVPSSVSKVVRERTIVCSSRMNKGRSGKQFTTTWKMDGKPIAKADLLIELK